jgi:hypothetical protein
MNSTPDNTLDVYDFARLVTEVGMTKAQAVWVLSRAQHTGHEGESVVIGADAVEMHWRQLPAELRDDGEEASP